MDIERSCYNCEKVMFDIDEEPCYDCGLQCSNFVPRKDLVELHRLLEEKQGKLRKAVDAIEKHKIDWVDTEENAKVYMETYPSCATTKLWKTLEELQ